MLFKVPAGIHRELSVCVVAVASCLTGPPSREMLYHGIDAVRTPSILAALCSLKSVAVRPRHFHGQLRMFAKCIRKPHPSRLRGQIDLRGQCRRDSQRPVFRRADLPKFSYRLRLKCSSQADSIRPFGDGFSGHTHVFRRSTRPVPRVRAVVGGYSKAGVFRQGLKPVVPFDRSLRVLQLHDQHVAHPVFYDEFLLLIR